MAIETPGLTMPGLTAWNQTASHVASFGLTTAVIVGVGAAAAEIDPQDAEFLASVNKIIAEFGAQPGASTSQARDRIVAAASNMGAVKTSKTAVERLLAATRNWARRDNGGAK